MAALFRMERSVSYAAVEHAGRVAAESLLTMTVGVLLGRLAWVALSPAEASPSAQQVASAERTILEDGHAYAPSSLLTQMNPFDTAPGALSESAVTGNETTLDLKLAGVRSVDGNTTASSAVIAFPDGHQTRFVPGDEVMPGILLVNVTESSVHLSRNGILETLGFFPADKKLFAPEISAPAADTPLTLASAGPHIPNDVTPAALAADTTLTPEFRGGQVSGYRMTPRGAGAFEAAGLETGDLILRINGQAIEGLRPAQISQSVSSGSDVALDVVRQGAIVRLRVTPDASLSQ